MIRTLWGFGVFLVPRFLFVGYKLHSASLIFHEFQRADSNSCWSEKGGDIETGEEQSSGGTALGQDPGSYAKIMHKNILGSSAELGPHPGRGWLLQADRKIPGAPPWLPHHQPIRRKSHILQPSPQILPSFSGHSDDHHVWPPVWPLSASSLTGPSSFRLNCYFYKGGSQL